MKIGVEVEDDRGDENSKEAENTQKDQGWQGHCRGG